MPGLLDFLSPQRRLLRQEQELKLLRREVEKLRAQNDSMRAGMRRCVSCDYRIDYKQRQTNDASLVDLSTPDP